MGEQKAQAGASADRRKLPHCRANSTPHRPRTRRRGIGGQRGYIVAEMREPPPIVNGLLSAGRPAVIARSEATKQSRRRRRTGLLRFARNDGAVTRKSA